MRLATRLASAAIVAVVVSSAGEHRAHAEPPAEDPEVLFEDGNRLMDEGKDAEACPLFERSLAIDPSIGTRLNLAICYEKIGRLGTAYRLFRTVAQIAHDTGKAKREEAAREHMTTLRENASFVAITLAEPAAEPVVRVDGAPVATEDYAFVPLDPGDHTVEAIAARKKPFSATVTVTEPREEKHEITIPPLEAELERVVEKKVEVKTVVNTRRTWAYIAGGVGAVGAVTAAVTGIVVASAQSTADDHCTRPIPNSDKLGCDPTGSSAVRRGETLVPINAAAVGVAVVGLGIGTFLFFTSSPRTSTGGNVAVGVGPGSAAISGRF